MSRKLIVTDGRRERELLLVSKIVVGRDPTCDLSEADPLLSRRHAEFSIDGDSIVVRDLGSRNGIYVNGSRIAEGTLESGDIVRIGHLHLRYVEDSAPITAMPELSDDATSLVFPGSGGSAGTPPPAAQPPRVVQPFGSRLQPAPDDGVHPTRVVPPPMRKSAVQPPSSAPVEQTSIQPPPSPPAEDADEPTSVVLSRPRTAVQPRTDSAPADTARQARALATAVEAIATFLGSSTVSRSAADAVKSLERDLANVSPPADLVNGLKGLAARVSAAAKDLP